MQFEISDEAAVVFASAFYQQLAAGSAVDASVAAARLAMFAERSDQIEWGTPVLFMRVRDGQIFDFAGRGPSAAPAGDSSVRPSALGVGTPSIHSLRGDERGSERGRSPDLLQGPRTSTHRTSWPDRGLPTAWRPEARERHDRLVAERTGEPHLIYRDVQACR